MYGQWKGRGVKLIGVGLQDTRSAVEGFVRRHHLTFPNGYDADERVARAFGFTYQPYWAVIGRDGTLLGAGYGPSGEAELVATIKKLAGP